MYGGPGCSHDVEHYWDGPFLGWIPAETRIIQRPPMDDPVLHIYDPEYKVDIHGMGGRG
jgi:hypothetical protein